MTSTANGLRARLPHARGTVHDREVGAPRRAVAARPLAAQSALLARTGRKEPTGSAKTALLPAILGDVNNAGGGGAPIERENGGDHLMAIENTEKKRRRKKYIYK